MCVYVCVALKFDHQCVPLMDKMILSCICAEQVLVPSNAGQINTAATEATDARPLCQPLSLSLLSFADFLIGRSSDKTLIFLTRLRSVVPPSRRGNVKHTEDGKAVITVSEPARMNRKSESWEFVMLFYISHRKTVLSGIKPYFIICIIFESKKCPSRATVET